MTIPKQLLEAKICNKNTCELKQRINETLLLIDLLKFGAKSRELNVFDLERIENKLKGSDKE